MKPPDVSQSPPLAAGLLLGNQPQVAGDLFATAEFPPDSSFVAKEKEVWKALKNKDKAAIAEIRGYQPGVPPNGKFQRFPELAVHRLVNGRLAEQWDFSDTWGANIQAGLLDPTNWPASALCRSEPTRTGPSR